MKDDSFGQTPEATIAADFPLPLITDAAVVADATLASSIPTDAAAYEQMLEAWMSSPPPSSLLSESDDGVLDVVSGHGPQVSATPSVPVILRSGSFAQDVMPGWSLPTGQEHVEPQKMTRTQRLQRVLITPPAFFVAAAMLIGVLCFGLARHLWADPANYGSADGIYYEREQLAYLDVRSIDVNDFEHYLAVDNACIVMVHNDMGSPLRVETDVSNLRYGDDQLPHHIALAADANGLLGPFEEPSTPEDPPRLPRDLETSTLDGENDERPCSETLSWLVLEREGDTLRLQLTSTDERSWDDFGIYSVMAVSRDYVVNLTGCWEAREFDGESDDIVPSSDMPAELTVEGASRFFVFDEDGGYDLYVNGERIPQQAPAEE